MRRGNGGRLGFENGRTRLNSLSFFFRALPQRRIFFLDGKRMDTPGREATSEINQTAFATSEDLRWGILRSSLAFLSNPNDCFDMR